MTIAFVNTIPQTNGSSPLTTASYIPGGAGNSLFQYIVCNGATGITFSVTASAGGTFSQLATSTGNGTQTISAMGLLSCAAGSQTFTINDGIANFDNLIIGCEYSGVGSLTNDSSITRANPGTGAGAILGTAVTVPVGSVLVAFCIETTSSETITATAGTSRSSSAFNPSYQLVDYAGTGGSVTPAFTTSANGTLSYTVFQVLLNPPVVASLADGYKTAPVATVLTGTGGSAMPAVTQGQQADVLVYIINSSPCTCTISDTLGTNYGSPIQHVQSASEGTEIYRFQALFAVGGTPVITATIGNFPVSAQIAVAINSGLNQTSPFIIGNVAFGDQFPVTVGLNQQFSPALPSPASLPVLLGAWGINSQINNAPAAGSGFVSGGTAGSGAGAAYITYETAVINTASPQTATFTPASTNRAYTLAALFNLPGGVVLPAGPMPRQIYIMP